MALTCEQFLDRTAVVKPAFGFYIGRAGIVRVVEHSKADGSSLRGYASPIPTGFNLLNAENTKSIVGVCSSLILGIYLWRDYAKICYRVVVWSAIYVVDVTNRKFAVDIQPCQTVSTDKVTINPDSLISERAGISRNKTRVGISAALLLPSENARCLIVVKQFAQAIWCKIWRNHAASIVGQLARALASFARCKGLFILRPCSR